MSAKISWQIELLGLDANITKLRTLDSLLNSISRKGGLLGGAGGGINIAGGGGGTTILPGGTAGHGGTGGSAMGTAAAAAAGVSLGTSTTRLNERFKAIKNDVDRAAASMGQTREEFFRSGGFRQQGAPQPNVNPNDLRWTRNKGRPGEWAPPVIKHTENLHIQESAILRNLHASAIRFGRGIGESYGKGPMGAKIGDAAFSSYSRILSPIGLLVTAFLVLHKVVKLLAEGIKQGAEAYRNAARMGGEIGAHFQAMSAFKAIGMEGIDMSLLQGQFNPRAKKYGVPDTDMILGAARAGQFGNVQQLTNMAEEFKAAMKDASSSAKQMESSAKANQQLSAAGSAISREWHTLLSQMSADMYPVIYGLERFAVTLFKILNWMEEHSPTTLAKRTLGLIPEGSSFSQIGGMMGKTGPNFTSWEKMGFQFGKSANGPMENIANNTRETVKEIKELNKTLRSAAITGAISGWNMIQGVPTLPSLP